MTSPMVKAHATNNAGIAKARLPACALARSGMNPTMHDIEPKTINNQLRMIRVIRTVVLTPNDQHHRAAPRDKVARTRVDAPLRCMR